MTLLIEKSTKLPRLWVCCLATTFTFANSLSMKNRHPQMYSVYWLPWVVLAFIVAAKTVSDRKRCALCFGGGGLLAMVLYSSFYVGWFAIFALGIFAIFFSVLEIVSSGAPSYSQKVSRQLNRVAAALFGFGLGLLPFLYTYLPVLGATERRAYSVAMGFAGRPGDKIGIFADLVEHAVVRRVRLGVVLEREMNAVGALLNDRKIAANDGTVRGGEEVGALTLTRFYAIHVMALPMALMGLTAGHLYLVRRLHISGPVTKQKGKPVKFYPTQLFRDAIVLLVAIGWLLVLAYLAKPELGPVANPARVDFTPKPEWYFLGLYELLKLLPPQLESVGTFFIPMGMMVGMFFLPWLDRSDSRHPAKRRWIIDIAIVTILGIGILTLKGLLS